MRAARTTHKIEVIVFNPHLTAFYLRPAMFRLFSILRSQVTPTVNLHLLIYWGT